LRVQKNTQLLFCLNPVLLRGTERAPSLFPTLIRSYRNLCVYVFRPRRFHVTFPFLVLFSVTHPKPSVGREETKRCQKMSPTGQANVNISRGSVL